MKQENRKRVAAGGSFLFIDPTTHGLTKNDVQVKIEPIEVSGHLIMHNLEDEDNYNHRHHPGLTQHQHPHLLPLALSPTGSSINAATSASGVIIKHPTSAESNLLRRKANFSEEEKWIITQEFVKDRKVLLSKMTNAATNRKKKELWRSIATMLNATRIGPLRTPDDVRKKWKAMVFEARREYSDSLRSSSIKISGLSKRILDICGKESITQGPREHSNSSAECDEAMDDGISGASVYPEVVIRDDESAHNRSHDDEDDSGSNVDMNEDIKSNHIMYVSEDLRAAHQHYSNHRSAIQPLAAENPHLSPLRRITVLHTTSPSATIEPVQTINSDHSILDNEQPLRLTTKTWSDSAPHSNNNVSSLHKKVLTMEMERIELEKEKLILEKEKLVLEKEKLNLEIEVLKGKLSRDKVQ